MKGLRGFVDAVMDHSRVVVVVLLLATVAVGAGAPMVEQSSSLDQFQTDSPEADKLDYIEANFDTGQGNTTTAQVIVRDDNVLDRESLDGILAYQQSLRDNDTVGDTLSGDQPTTSIANALATAAIQREEGRDVQSVATELQRLNESVTEQRAAIEARNETLSRTAGLLREELTYLRENPEASVSASFDEVRAETPVDLNESDAETFARAARGLREATTKEQAEQAYQLGTRGVLAADYQALQERGDALQADAERLRELSDELEAERADLREARNATLTEQREQLASMNESELEAVIGLVLGDDGGSGAFAFMPTDYDPGSTTAEATVLLVSQESESASVNTGAAGEAVTDGQLAMEELGAEAAGGEYLVFGAGVIGDEIDSSMSDSLLIVGPLALIFVLVALAVAYRDVLDILLGLVGIAAVLVWTFGFMGWTGIDFNQIFIAVPVLLIGLSIDYAIHIFMRHREERVGAAGGDDAAPRGSMRTALAGVGIALVYVTATTVIGFLSNLTSPVGPIQDFGVVSAVGILAALLVFGLLVPALKVELDELLEGVGLDRRKRAFGTGGGAFSSVLSVGATAARKAPYLVILGAVLLSAGGAYGATQVDTSFSQEDFLAEDPPDWMDDLPEPFRPGEYTAKSNLQYVNDNFVREDSQAQILIEGSVTDDDTLERLADAEAAATEKNVTQTLSNGQADTTSPVSVMAAVAAENETFNATYTAADTDGDGVPDRDLAGVYDALFEVAPDRAGSVIDRQDGEYVAARLVISVKGGASGADITDQMGEVADELDGGGLEATATGSAILNEIVQQELLDTVVQSLIITLVATFVFLMITYRITEGSATLGAVTLLPVAFSVTWILGTMYLLEIPFNVLTGMITSLTVGLGVAYSIHLSERYNQELERTGEMWTAMERAVTGTGGALLGSAATTVGGFGVLVFAILPPLQQFGQITGLTIVYAFLASVLLLPSLLTAWTRATGAADTAPGENGDLPPDAPAVAAVEGDATPGAVRRIDRTVVAPGEAVEVVVAVRGVEGRAVLNERSTVALVPREGSPEPVDTAGTGGSLYAVFDDGLRAFRYELRVPEEAGDGDEIRLDGEVTAGGTTLPIDGDGVVSVVPDPFERIAATGEVSAADLQDAHDRYEAGDLTETQLGRVHQAWVRGDRAPELEGPADD